MMPRTSRVRLSSVLWAGLQVATPALSSLADARLAAAAGAPVAHVESTSAASCPAIHAPDCAVCRYLSGAAAGPDAPEAREPDAEDVRASIAQKRAPATRTVVLPDGRAPPGR